jgi:hypothetical protein
MYREYAAVPALAFVVDRIWTLEGHAREMADVQPVLPDGRPEIILHLGDPFERVHGDGETGAPGTGKSLLVSCLVRSICGHQVALRSSASG